MMCLLPYEIKFDKYNNHYNKAAALEIAEEYGVSNNFFKYSGHYYFWKDSHASFGKWIMPDSKGFTKEGLMKVSESIRVYTYLILTSQSAARHAIVGDGADELAAQ